MKLLLPAASATVLFVGQGEVAAAQCPAQTDSFTCQLTLVGGGPILPSIWTEFDPLGASAISTDNNTGQLAIPLDSSINDGTDMWSGSDNTAPRVYQAIADVDFSATLKIGTLVNTADLTSSSEFQDQGIFIRVDDDTFLRFSSFAKGGHGSYSLFVSYIDGDSNSNTLHEDPENFGLVGPPRCMRVTRQDDKFSFYATNDDECGDFIFIGEYSFSIVPTGVGIFASNPNLSGGLGPVFEARFDSFILEDILSSVTSFVTPKIWTSFDPRDASAIAIDESNGHLGISLDSNINGGTNMWTGSDNTAPRIYQTLANNEDFSVVLKFATLVDTTGLSSNEHQDHGIFVRIDDDSFLRFSSFAKGGGSGSYSLFVSYINGGSASNALYEPPTNFGLTGPPKCMRLVRFGNEYFFYATNDEDCNDFLFIGQYSYSVVPTGVGIFAANPNLAGGGGPVFDARFEYFEVSCMQLSNPVCG